MVGLRIRVSENTNDAEAWCEIGFLLLRQGKSKEAKEVFQRVIQLDDKQFRAWAGLGLIAANARKLKDAVDFYKKAVKINSDFKDGWMALARIYLYQKKFKDSEKAYKKYRPTTPEESLVLATDRASLYMAWEKYSKAEEEFRKAISIKPDDAIIKLNLVSALNHQKKPEGRELEKEIMEGPHSVEVWMTIALYWRTRAIQEKDSVRFHMKKVVSVCRKILRIDKDHIHAHLITFEWEKEELPIFISLDDPYFIRPYSSHRERIDVIKKRRRVEKHAAEIEELIQKSDDEAAIKGWKKLRISEYTFKKWKEEYEKQDWSIKSLADSGVLW